MFLHRTLPFIALVTTGWLGWSPNAAGRAYVAFSVREAMTRAEAGAREDTALQCLGGMTRVLGMVHDPTHGDIILVGRVVNGLPAARLDDLVVALRARIVHKEWPEVSIEPSKESYDTRRQLVLLRGHIERTLFGEAFVDCDVTLKKHSIGSLPAIRGIPSYKSLCLEDIKAEVAKAGATVTGFRWADGEEADKRIGELRGSPVQGTLDYRVKFWFNPREPRRVASYQGVFCIEEMRMGVQADFQPATRSEATAAGADRPGEHPGKVYAKALTEHYDTLITTYPELNRLKVLFDLVAVAEAIRELENRPDLDYLLHRYAVAPGRTPRDYPLSELCGFVDRSDGLCHAVKISGGIKPRAAIDWLNDGDVTKLREIVLESRPSPNALVWNPRALDKWEMPNAQSLNLGKPESDTDEADFEPSDNRDVGCTVVTQSVLLRRTPSRPDPMQTPFSGFGVPSLPSESPGGVDMEMQISERLFSKRYNRELEAFRENFLKGRPSGGALSWPIKRKEKPDRK